MYLLYGISHGFDITRDLLRFKIQYAFIRQEHNIIYNHINENIIRLETSTKEQKEPLS